MVRASPACRNNYQRHAYIREPVQEEGPEEESVGCRGVPTQLKIICN
jgi:hypothetical protein